MNPEALLAHADFVRALARRLLNDVHRAEDVVQDTWVAALEKPPRDKVALRAWLSAVTRNFARMARRSEKSRVLREHATSRHEGVASASDVVEWEVTRRRVVEAVLGLEEPYRVAIITRFYQDLPPREMAKRLGVPVETARTRVKRGLERLKAKLDADYNGDRKAWCLALAPVAGWKLGGAAAATPGLSSLISGVSAMVTKMKVGLAAAAVFVVAAALVVLFYEGHEKTNDPRGSFSEGTDGSAAVKDVDSTEPDGNQPPDETRDTPTKNASTKIPGAGVALYGRVLDETGEPVQGVVIEETRVEVHTGSVSDDAIWMDTRHRSDAEGRFVLPVSAGCLPLTFLRFVHPEYENRTVPLVTAVMDYEEKFRLDEIRLNPASYIRGIVADERGRPMEGCMVSAPGKPWDTGKWDNHDRTLTNMEGRFQLKLRERKPMRVTAFEEEKGIGWSEPITPGLGRGIPYVRITLIKGLPMAGRVFSAGGAPAGGIRLFIEGRPGDNEIRLETVSDDEGGFRFPPLPAATYRIETPNLGIPGNHNYYESWKNLVLADHVSPGAEGLSLILPQGSRLILHLKDPAGNPILLEPDLRFEQIVSGDDNMLVRTSWDWPSTLSKIAPGTFGLDHVHHGKYKLDVRVEGYSPCLGRRVEVPPPPGQVEAAITLHPLKAITGKVIDADGTPAPGVAVIDERIMQSSYVKRETSISFLESGVRKRTYTMVGKTVVTDEGGRFRIEGISGGKHLLCCVVKGREVCTESPVIVTDENPLVEVDITLPKLSGSIEGVVRDGRGLPIKNALVVAWDGNELFNTARADDEGRYAFFNMPDGRYVVDAREFDCRELRSNVNHKTSPVEESVEDLERLGLFNAYISNGEACRCDLTVPDPWNGVIRGRLLSCEGELPDGVYIDLDEDEPEEPALERRRHSLADLFDTAVYYWDRDSRYAYFRFENVPAGQYRVNVWWKVDDDPFRDRFIESGPVIVEPYSKHDLELYLAFSSLKGKVTDRASGMPVKGARIRLLDDKSYREIDLACREDGSFEGIEVPSGKYKLAIQHPDYRPFIKEIDLLEKVNVVNLFCELEPGCSVRGVLKLEEGAWSRYRWHVIPEIPPIGAYWYAGGRVKENGSFSLNGLPPGKRKFYVFDGSKPVFELTATLPLPEGEKLLIELP